MYLLLFCTHVQSTPVGKEAPKKKPTTLKKSNNSDSRIRIRVDPDYPESQIKPKTEKEYCKFTSEVCRKFSKVLRKDKTKQIECQNKSKECYCACCYEKRLSRNSPTIPPIHS